MKITDVKTYIAGNPWKNWLFAQVETDEGLKGTGEGTLNAFAKTIEAAIHELKPFVIGMDPFQVEMLQQRLVRDVYSEGGQIHMCAVAAIEIACWDIIGKATNQPVYNLLGGRCHARLRAYANGWYRGPRTPQNFGEKAREVVRRGYTALKFDPFGDNWRQMTPTELRLSVDIVGAVREAVGPEVDVLVEGHSRFSGSTALQVAREIAQFRPTWFEEPVPHQNVAALVEVARHSPVPIATGESLSSKHAFAELLKHEAVQILQPEPLNLGGLLPARQVAAMADAHYAVIAPHSAQGPLCSVACAHLNCATPNFFLHEIFDEFNEPWEREVLKPALEVRNGYIELSGRPGLGVELNLDEVLKHPYQQEHYIPLFRSGWEMRKPVKE